MYSLFLDSGLNEFWIIVIGFIGVFFVLPHVLSAVFDKADKEASKGNGSCLGVLLTIFMIFIVVVWILQIKDCTNKSDSGGNDIEWQFKHTDRHY